MGPIGVIAADSLLGEVTAAMANAVSSSEAEKLLIPVNTCGFYVAGVGSHTLSELIDDVIQMIKV